MMKLFLVGEHGSSPDVATEHKQGGEGGVEVLHRTLMPDSQKLYTQMKTDDSRIFI